VDNTFARWSAVSGFDPSHPFASQTPVRWTTLQRTSETWKLERRALAALAKYLIKVAQPAAAKKHPAAMLI